MRRANDTVTDFDGEPPYAHQLSIRKDAHKSRMFNNLGEDYGEHIIHTYKHHNVSLFSHNHGVSPDLYEQSHMLRDFFRVLPTSFDHNKTESVALNASKHYPIYGSQFHPYQYLYE